jgi:primosomal protein N'
VPLRKKSIEGIVVDVGCDGAGHGRIVHAAQIEAVIGTEPLLPPTSVHALWWMAEYYHCPLRYALTPFLPAHPGAMPRERTHRVSIACNARQARQAAAGGAGCTADTGPLARDVLRRSTSAASATIRTGGEKDIKEERTHAEILQPVDAYETTEARPDIQPGATVRRTTTIKSSIKPSLLFGITGSGKTEIYASSHCRRRRAGEAERCCWCRKSC